MFDPTWMADLMEMQRKAAELARERTAQSPDTAALVQGLVAEYLRKWGINHLPWEDRTGPGNVYPEKGATEATTGVNWNIDVTETKNHVTVETTLPGVTEENDILIKLRGDVLSINGRCGVQPDRSGNDDGTFCRQVRLPVKVAPVGAEASYQDKKLKIILPKITAEAEVTIPLSYFQPQ